MEPRRINPTVYQHTFGPNDPAVRIRPGERVIAETLDARGDDRYGKPIPEHMRQQMPGTELCRSNPLVGPIFVEGAKPGDILAVTIETLALNRDYAYSQQSPRFGSLTGEGPGKVLTYNDPIPSIPYRWTLDLAQNTGRLDMPQSAIGFAEVDLAPFIGSIGVAPRYGRIETSLTPGEFGGNMDYPGVSQGSTLYLPVWVQGAYLSFGDIHARQGDGEVNGTAMETTAEITLKIDLIENPKTPANWPRLENQEAIMVIGSTRPLMDAVKVSQIELLNWLTGDFGFERTEVWQLMGQVGQIRIGNIVDPAYTAVSLFPKKYLPA